MNNLPTPSAAPSAPVYELATHGRRCGAALLDAVYASVSVFLCTAAGLAIAKLFVDDAGHFSALGYLVFGALGGALGSLLAVLLLVWQVGRAGEHNGQTWGKQAFLLRVVRDSGRPMNLRWALLRELIGKGGSAVLVFSLGGVVGQLLFGGDGGSLTSFLALALLSLPFIFDEERRALHDRLARTHVVQELPDPTFLPAPTLAETTPAEQSNNDDAA